jgi:hypothetical protein
VSTFARVVDLRGGVSDAFGDRPAVLRSGGKVVPAASRPITVYESDRPTRSHRPDVLARWPSDTLPIDAKYKKYGEINVSEADVHQLLTMPVPIAVTALRGHWSFTRRDAV